MQHNLSLCFDLWPYLPTNPSWGVRTRQGGRPGQIHREFTLHMNYDIHYMNYCSLHATFTTNSSSPLSQHSSDKMTFSHVVQLEIAVCGWVCVRLAQVYVLPVCVSYCKQSGGREMKIE